MNAIGTEIPIETSYIHLNSLNQGNSNRGNEYKRGRGGNGRG